MGEKSRTRLHNVADDVNWTSLEESDSRRNSGSAMPTSTKEVRRVLTDLESEWVHWHAADRNPTAG